MTAWVMKMMARMNPNQLLEITKKAADDWSIRTDDCETWEDTIEEAESWIHQYKERGTLYEDGDAQDQRPRKMNLPEALEEYIDEIPDRSNR